MSSVYRASYEVKGRTRRRLWYVSFKDHCDVWRKLRGWTDKGATEELERRLDRLVAARAVNQVPDAELAGWLEGLTDYHRGKLAEWGLLDERAASLAKPLVERDDRGRVVGGHVHDHHAALIARGNTRSHADLVRARLARLVEGCGFTRWTDIRSGRVEAWLAGRRAAGMKGNTSNHIATAIGAFCGWMVEDGRAAVSPLAAVKAINVADQVPFGVFTPEQVQALLDHCEGANDLWPIEGRETREAVAAARARRRCNREGNDSAEAFQRYYQEALDTMPKPERFLTGPQRAVLYRFAAETALRAGTIRSLEAGQVRIERDKAGNVIGGVVKTTVGQQKNRRAHNVPLRRSFAAWLDERLAGKVGAARVFELPTYAAAMLRNDLVNAGLPLVDEDGLPLRFHSFRATCATWLGEAGLESKDIAMITGHQSRAMCDRYTHATLRAGRRAIEMLPDLRSPRRSTGTAEAVPGKVLEKDAAAKGRGSAADGRSPYDEPRWGGRAVEGAGLENRYPP